MSEDAKRYYFTESRYLSKTSKNLKLVVNDNERGNYNKVSYFDDIIIYYDRVYKEILLNMVEKLIRAKKIFKQFKAYEFIKPRLKKFVFMVKEKFYNPDSERNFMKLHAGKYVGTLGPKVKV